MGKHAVKPQVPNVTTQQGENTDPEAIPRKVVDVVTAPSGDQGALYPKRP